MTDRARAQAYLFAHRSLPASVGARWSELRLVFQSGAGAALLRSLWDGLGDRLPEDARIEDPGGLTVRPVAIDDRRAGFLVTFPRPERPGEAAVALIPDRPSPTRYFTLELGDATLRPVPDWYLCEWTEDEHVNYGTIASAPDCDPVPVLPAMLERVATLLSSERRDPPTS